MFGKSALWAPVARVRFRFMGITVAAAAVVTAAVGCSSGSSTPPSSTATSSAATSSAAAASGSPLDVWAIQPLSNAVGLVPQVPAGAKAAARYINANGGVGAEHHQLVVKVCDSQGSPQGEVQCAQQAAADTQAIAVVNPVAIYNADAFAQVLRQAGLASINPFIATPAALTNPINFPLYSPNFGSSACAVLGAKAANIKRVAFAQINLPISQASAQTAAQLAQKQGLTVTGSVTFPVTVSDLSPYVKQLQATSPQLVVLNMQPNLVGQFMQASNSLGAQWAYCAQDGITVWQQMVGLGAIASNFYYAATLPEVTVPSSNPIVTAFRAQATAEANSGDQAAGLAPTNEPASTFQAWMAVQTVFQVAGKMSGTIDRQSFLAALNKATVTFPGVLPPIDFAKPNPVPQYSRLFNTTLFLKKWDVATKSEQVVTSVPPTQFGTLVG
jgi:ABC-type branched-subunit amino acid transport system substrate-binding protein